MLNYSSKSYWDERYKILNTRTYDWLEDYDNLRKFFLNLNIPKEANILNVGSGTSQLSEKMYDDGYTNNYNIDISLESLYIMKKRNDGIRPKLNYIQMNAKKMYYGNNFFDVVIDKGLLDTILCGENALVEASKLTKEITRVLKPNGIYILISFGSPKERLKHLQWDYLDYDIEVYDIKNFYEDITKKSTHYIYLCRKQDDADEKLKYYEDVLSELKTY